MTMRRKSFSRCLVLGPALIALGAVAGFAQSWNSGRAQSNANSNGPWLDYMPDDNPTTTVTVSRNSASGQARADTAVRATSAGDTKAIATGRNKQCKAAFVARHYDQALSLCQQAMDMGDTDARLGMAAIYRLGLKQCARAAPYYAMEKNANPIAAVGLGELYWLGCPDFATDYRKARNLFGSAANRGYSGGWEDLGWMDELGLGAPHNRQKAILELSEAAGRGDVWARDVMLALKNARDSDRFHSPEELGRYAADARFSRDLGAYQADQANQPRGDGSWLQCAPGNPAIPGNHGWCMLHH